MRVDIHPGKLREVRFIPGIVGKKFVFATFCFAKSTVCHTENFLAGVEINLNDAS
jgi:hypothetical protein